LSAGCADAALPRAADSNETNRIFVERISSPREVRVVGFVDVR
jgi:hypothetical protein